MATNRKRTPRSRKDIIQLDDSVREYLLYGTSEEGTPGNELCCSRFFDQGQEIMEAWEAHKGTLLKEWIERQPGTRPSRWWWYEAPAEPVVNSKVFTSGQWSDAHRRRLGGTGTPNYEVLAYAPHFEYGIPEGWIDESDMKAHAIFFKGKAVFSIDPNDPPTFESEATYLKRHNLLMKEEEKHLKTADFEPEAIKF